MASAGPSPLWNIAHDCTDSLPRLSQAVPKPAFAVNNLDLSDRPVRSRFLPLHGRTFDGNVVSFSRKPAKRTVFSVQEIDDQSKVLAKLAMSMLEHPMHRMLDNIAAAESEKAAKAEECASSRCSYNDQDEQVRRFEYEPLPLLDKGKGRADAGSMWTDRYRPKLYTDLLGDDRVHRAAMSWLKEWDQCVFKTSVGGAAQARKKAMAAKKRTWSERDENAVRAALTLCCK